MPRISRWAAILAACASACSSGHRPAPEEWINLLASDVHIVVAGTQLVLPLIASPDFVSNRQLFSLDRRGDARERNDRLRAFVAAARQPSTAPILDIAEVEVRAFGLNDFDSSYRRLCGRFTREWSRAICDLSWAPLVQALPQNGFHLADREKLGAFGNHPMLTGETLGERLKAMRLNGGKARVICNWDKGTERRSGCTAASRLSGDLIAVWTVWDADGEDAEQMAAREARVIGDFVLYGLGAEEDHLQLLKTACASRRPGHAVGPYGEDPCLEAPGASVPTNSAAPDRRPGR